MAIRKVARLGHPILRKVAEPIPERRIRSLDVQRLLDDMVETLIEYNGVGLAAPQVHESVQAIVAQVPKGFRGSSGLPLLALLNPVIVASSEEIEEDWEGCLSIPDLRGKVPRHRSIRVRATDRGGKEREWEFEGFPARVIQHEIDHLHGIVFLDRMTDFQTLTFEAEFQRYVQNAGT